VKSTRLSAIEKKARLGQPVGWLAAGLFLLLGALVVVWGTEYKLSLYRAEPTVQMPAKLCTRSSEAAKSQVHLAIRPTETAVPQLDTISIGPGGNDNEGGINPATAPPDLPPPSSPVELPQVAFRPPPARAHVAV